MVLVELFWLVPAKAESASLQPPSHRVKPCIAFLAASFSTEETRQRQALNVLSFPLPPPLPLLVGYLFILLAIFYKPAGCTVLGFQAISTC